MFVRENYIKFVGSEEDSGLAGSEVARCSVGLCISSHSSHSLAVAKQFWNVLAGLSLWERGASLPAQCLPPVWALRAGGEGGGGGGGGGGPLRYLISHTCWANPPPCSHPSLTFWSDTLIIHLMFLTCHDAVMRRRQTRGGRFYWGREGGRVQGGRREGEIW